MNDPDLEIEPSSGNVFLDLGFPPHEAAVLLLRCEVAEALRRWVHRRSQSTSRSGRSSDRPSSMIAGHCRHHPP